MGHEDREVKYSQLASEERQLGNDDQLLENERVNHLRHPVTYIGARRYRILVGCAATFALVFSVVQLLLTVDVRMRVREKAAAQSLDRHESEIISTPSDPKWPCGITREEAMKTGCYFDLGLVAWLPRECYNKELDESFRANNPFKIWYPNDDNTGPNIIKPIATEAELQERPIQMVDLGWPGYSWSTLEYHDAHCMHTWQYLHQAVLKGKKVPTSITGWSHTTHCTHAALIDTSNITYQEISPTAHNRYPACIDLESLKGEMLDLY